MWGGAEKGEREVIGSKALSGLDLLCAYLRYATPHGSARPRGRVVGREADDDVAEGRDGHGVAAHRVREVPGGTGGVAAVAEEAGAPGYDLECVAYIDFLGGE